jgi:hypothetical protein
MPEHRADPAPRLWLALLALIAAVMALALVFQAREDSSANATASSTARPGIRGYAGPSNDAPVKWPASTPTSAAGPAHWVHEFRRLDALRETAWRAGSPAGLRAVYVQGSGAHRIDEMWLSSYARRGLVVRGISVDLLSLRVVARSAGRVWLEVLDRLGPAVAVDGHGHERALPRDEPTRHRIELRRVDGDWRIAKITVLVQSVVD